jgi:hypothetical protein
MSDKEENINMCPCGEISNLIYYSDSDDAICPKCFKDQSDALLHYKNMRTKIFPECEEIIEGIFLGNEDAAIS